MSKLSLLAAVAAASLVSFGFQPATNNASFTRDGVTYVQRGGLKNCDFVATNVDASAVSRVQSVNSKTGAVHLAYSDVGALPATTSHLPGDVPTNRTVNAKSLDADVTLDASDVSALPDDYVKLTNSATFKSAVETVSPPVELPSKWALANVTNASGGAVTADNVGAVPAERRAQIGSVEYHMSYPLFRTATYLGYRYTTGMHYGINISKAPTGDDTKLWSLNLWNDRIAQSAYDVSDPSNPIMIQWENEFPTEPGRFATTGDVATAVSEATYDSITSTNLVLTSGGPGNVILNADLSVCEQPDPAYSVTVNPEPAIPSVITGRTTRSASTLLSYNLKGLRGNEYVYETDLGAEKWTDAWYGSACPSNISYRTTDGVWILRNGAGQIVEMPAADYPKYRVMMAKQPLLASYRLGSYVRYWVAAPNAWTTTSAGGFDDTYPQYETNWFPVVRTKVVRRDEMGDWAMSPSKPTYTAVEVGALPSSKYLTTTSYYSDIERFAVGGLYANSSVNQEYFGIYKLAGMNSQNVSTYTNTQYRADHIMQKVEATSPTSTDGTFALPLKFPFKAGTIARTEDLDGYVPKTTKVNGQPLTGDVTIQGMVDNAIVLTNGTLKTYDGTTTFDAVTRSELTTTVNAVKDLHYDAGLNVTWTNIIHNGHIYYVTVTNANVATP